MRQSWTTRLPRETMDQLAALAKHMGPGISPTSALIQIVNAAARQLPDPPPEAVPTRRGGKRTKAPPVE